MGKKPPLTIVGNRPDPVPTVMPPPRKLGEHGLALWNSLQREYRIEDAGGVEILAQACTALDRAEALRGRIDQDGEVIVTRSGLKTHPALKDEMAARMFITRSLSKLGVLDEPLKPIGRPPRGGVGVSYADE
jgi:hypothetical protein